MNNSIEAEEAESEEGGRRQRQLTDLLVMITPSMFGLNPETIIDNKFQPKSVAESEAEIRTLAMSEFAEMVEKLRAEHIQVVVCPTREDSAVITPDAVFPNNWISFHPNQIILYPMKAPNRRAERQLGKVKSVLSDSGFSISNSVLDLTENENRGQILEGTGSLVLDRTQSVGFASLSERTQAPAIEIFERETGYDVVNFHSVDRNGAPVYHTNVVMSVGERFAVLCADAIQDETERKAVLQKLQNLRKEVIVISLDQMHNFCGNILQVHDTNNQTKIIMSETAYNAFTPEQRNQLSDHGKLIVVSIPTIEKVGGGSARCMLAEVFGYTSNHYQETGTL